VKFVFVVAVVAEDVDLAKLDAAVDEPAKLTALDICVETGVAGVIGSWSTGEPLDASL
jgi:hypothetical protein